MSYWMAVRRRLAAIALAAVDVSALAIAYTGNMTDEIVTMGDGKQYRLLTLISSGTLSIPAEVKADVWLCGGGANGIGASGSQGGAGGGGGFVGSIYKTKIGTTVSCVVGAATGSSSFGSIVSANGANSPNGGSGGGARGYDWNSPPGTGAGISTYPFLDTTYFLNKPHCPGGGGGSTFFRTSSQWRGGTGGSNGSDGGNYVDASAGNGGVGGLYGGGAGGWQGADGWNGYHYGSGGGGGGFDGSSDEYGAGGAGYQGVIYARIPLDQKAA